MIFIGWIAEICIDLLACTYAPFMSFKAIQTDDGGKDDKEWLTFWVVYAVCMTGIFEYLFSWFPLSSELKLGIFIWMLFFKGSSLVYATVVEPFFKKYEKDADQMIADLPGTLQELSKQLGKDKMIEEAMHNATKFIAEYGPDAYRQVCKVGIKLAVEHANDRAA
eukprot:m.14387 g.14387  ORF g.14387 m.14387 type:complete len:165 (+) comp9027_c0_seq1:44-538(+)